MRIFRSIIGMEVQVVGNWFRLYMASVFGVTSFQLSLLRNYVFKLFSNCLQQVLSFQAFGPNFWLKAKINSYGSNILFPPSAIVAGISKSNWDMLEGMV